MKTSFIIGALSDTGVIKKINQDSIFAKIGESDEGEFALFVIADGMGGLSDGEVASRTCISFLKQWWDTDLKRIIYNSAESQLKDIAKCIVNIFYYINEKIIEYSQGISRRVGSTLSVLFIIKGQFFVCHIGDSRIYRLRGKRLEQLTEDHSLVALKVTNGLITKEQAKQHPERNILTQCIGVHKELNIFQAKGDVFDNDIFLLCSDGFYNKLSDEEIIASFSKNKDEDLDETIRNLINIIISREERDNISCMAVNIRQTEAFEKTAEF